MLYMYMFIVYEGHSETNSKLKLISAIKQRRLYFQNHEYVFLGLITDIVIEYSNMTGFFSPITCKSTDTNWALFSEKS